MAISIEQLIKDRANLNFVRTQYFFDTPREDDVLATSFLGTPIFSNLVFEGVDYRDFNDQVQTFDGFQLDICLMTANTENVILKTNIQGANGSIKELINNGDYSISVQGFIVTNNSNQAPVVQQTQLAALARVCASVRVVSSFLNALGVYEVVVDGVSFSEIEATRNMLAVTMNLTSETPIEIRLA